MKIGKRLRISAAVLALMVACSACSGVRDAVEPKKMAKTEPVEIMSYTEYPPYEKNIDGMHSIARKGKLELFLNEETGAFAVVDLSQSAVWHSNPVIDSSDTTITRNVRNLLRSQVIVSMMNPVGNVTKDVPSYSEGSMEGRAQTQITETGFDATYFFSEEGLTVTIHYRLLSDSLSVEVDTASVKEEGTSLLYGIKLLPFFGAAQNEEGYFLVPDGSGSLIYFDNQKSRYDSYIVPLYGKDILIADKAYKTVEQPAMLPVFGIQKSASGVVAICDQGAAYASLRATVSGQETAYNRIGYEFKTRFSQMSVIGDKSSSSSKEVMIIQKEALEERRFSVRYFFTGESEKGYSSMANIMRNYLIKQVGIQPNTDSSPSLYLSVKGMELRDKSVLGFPVQIAAPLTTFSQTQNALSYLADKGIENVSVIYDKVSRAALDGEIEPEWSFSSKLGKQSDLKSLLDFSEAHNDTVSMTVGNVLQTKSGNGYSYNKDTVKDMNKLYAEVYSYRRNIFSKDENQPIRRVLKPFKAAEALLSFGQSLNKTDSRLGVYLPEATGTLYSDFGSMRYQREETETALGDAIRALGENQKTTGNFCGAYALAGVADILNVPMESSRYDITDVSVPFYQLVMQGLRPYAMTPLNLEGDERRTWLKALETGSILQYQVIGSPSEADDGYFTDTFSGLQESLAQSCLSLEKVRAYTEGTLIADHTTDGTLSVTSYQNGVSIVINHKSEPQTYAGKELAPLSYRVMKGGNEIDAG